MNIKLFKVTTLLLSIGLLFITISNALHITHQMYSLEFSIVGSIAILVSYPFRFYLKIRKDIEDYIKLIYALGFGLIGILYENAWLSFGIYFTKIICFLLWIYINKEWFVQLIRYGQKNRGFVISVSILCLGALFKILHLMGADLIIITGNGLITLWFIKDILWLRKPVSFQQKLSPEF